jgi:putative membrane protein
VIASLPPFLGRIEEAIAAVEKRSAAELVVAVAPWSGHYRDADLLGAIALGLIVLALILFGPWTVHMGWVLPDVMVAGAIGWWASRRSSWLRRRLTSPRRREAQVSAEAARAFHEESLSATRDRSGVLLFVSLGEEEARIVPDFGVLQRVPESEWKRLELGLTRALGQPDWVEQLVQTIQEAGDRLSERFPVRPDDVDELPNTVRIRA